MMTRKAVLEKAVMTVLDKEPVHISSVTGVLCAECLQEIQGGPLLTGYTILIVQVENSTVLKLGY